MSEQIIDWDLALIQKYNYSGPRYTSYPTALEFSPQFGAAEFDAGCGPLSTASPVAVRAYSVLP
jgi:hypothetical protein